MASETWAATPVIDSFSASPQVVAPGGLVNLEVTAHDPDCSSTCTTGCGLYIRSDLTSWSADGGVFVVETNGTAASPYTASAQWQAPSTEATFTLSVSVSDSGGTLCGGRQSTVANLQVQVTSTPSNPPVIESLVGNPVSLYPGQTSQLTCAATDPDGDQVSYGWSTDFGSLIPGANGAATFEADRPGVAHVTCTASDPSGAATNESLALSVSDVEAERIVAPGLSSPNRLAVDSMGDLFVVDRGSGGIVVVRLETGDPMYRIPMPGAVSIAVDWNDHLLVGMTGGAGVFDRSGSLVLDLEPALGEVSDVAVDLTRRRYVSLFRHAGRVVIHDEFGAVIAEFGETGDGPAQLMGPSGVDVTPGGDVVVADCGHNLIKVFDLTGELVGEFGGAGGGAGKFVEIDDVAVGGDGVVFASDHYQDWVQSFNPDGTPREAIGTYGAGPGQFKTAAGLVAAEAFGSLLAASVNAPGIQVFRLGSPSPINWPVPDVQFSADALTFPNQIVGTASAPLDLMVTNNGNAPLGIPELEIVGPFSVAQGCDLVNPGELCSISLVFLPVAPGPSQGYLTIKTSADIGPHTVALAGSAFVPARAELNPTHLDFSTQGVATTSPARHVLVHNPGTVSLTISNILWTGPFEVGSSCLSQLSGGASCMLTIAFSPDSIGPVAGSLTIESSAEQSPHGITMSGEGILLKLTADPAVIDFGIVASGSVSRTEPVQILNTGSGAVMVGNLELSGENPADFILATDYCSHNPVDPGQSCWIEVEFSPGTTKESSAQLLIPTEPGLEYAVGLRGSLAPLLTDGFEAGNTSAWKALDAKALETAPATLDFSQMDLGAQCGPRVVTVRNTSGEPVYIGASWLQGEDAIEFVIDHDGCGSTWLEPGQGCTIGVTMLTLGEGSFSADLVIPATTTEKRQPGPVRLRGGVRLP